MVMEPSRELHIRLAQAGYAVEPIATFYGNNDSDIAFVEVVMLPCGPAVVLTYRSGMWDAATFSPEADSVAITADVIARACEPAPGWMTPEELLEFDG